ncbi:hypothetical protein CERZMDRAFT_98606 [Cercospora zeae-maydis SCOH1-5]|uniref:Transcription factor IIIC putative zinc-finger domain-containing protein n=1 Tax=Cercospora zeae-maydis SCOH1-5 TaxID=717836 RepID=A0A6A6FD38_9PEZI|nr:hypothetical protein CERZMDRAFT_98606 [Cercospora zeae-maydis SCOH1-5]
MACTVTVPFWPVSYDNLQWSKDNQIAVLGGEHVLIVTPRLKEPTPGRLWWDTENLIRINAFMMAECPRAPALTDRHLSIGEELSIFQAQAAAWSPSGLTKFRGSALAVQTSNHVLSLWAREAEAKEKTTWKRILVMNWAVRKFYQNLNASAPDAGLDERELEERLQIQQRIHSFTWVQPAYNTLERPHPDLFPGEQYLVVSTEGGHLLLVRIFSPSTRQLSGEGSWEALVVGNLAVKHATNLLGNENSDAMYPGSLFSQTSDNDYIAARAVAVGEWQTGESDGELVAALLFIAKGKLFSTVLVHDANGSASFGPSDSLQRLLHARSDLVGPLKITPGTDAGSAVLFGLDTVFQGQLVLDKVARSIGAEFQMHHLDDRWDDVTAAAITSSADGDPRLHIISHLSSLTSPTHALKLPLAPEDSATEQPAWYQALETSKSAFGATYDLGDHVQERSWGIACAPLGECTAVCASLHPNDVVAYIINAEQASLLNITFESEMSANPFELNPGVLGIFDGLPTSTVLFFLKRHLERKVESDSSEDISTESFVSDIQDLLSPKFITRIAQDSQHGDSLEALLSRARIRIFADQEVRRAHAQRVCDLAAQSDALRPDCIVIIFRKIAEVLFSLSHEHLDVDAISLSVRRLYDMALSKLDTNYRLGDTEPSARDWNEQCKICQHPIAFENFKWARCQQGHQFTRCALSLLAIQEPGITKHCGVCDLQYFDEGIAPDFQSDHQDIEMADVLQGEVPSTSPANDGWVKISQSGGATARAKATLARLLFAACDVCIFCGGKFEH